MFLKSITAFCRICMDSEHNKEKEEEKRQKEPEYL